MVRRATAMALLLASACKPELAGRPSEVRDDVVVAIRSSPAEVNPAAMPPAVVAYEALYIGPNGPADPSGLDWAFCDEPKPLALTGPIAPQCLVRRARDITVTHTPAGDAGEPTTEIRHVLTPFGTGLVARAAVPADGCRVFGPFPPDPRPNEPPSRPADPDTTGGYYQPIRLLIPTRAEPEFSVGVTRLDCGIAGATPEQTISYNKQHRPNENPAVAALVLVRSSGSEETVTAEPGSPGPTGDGGAVLDAGPTSDAAPSPRDDSGVPPATSEPPQANVAPGERVTLRASWAACESPCDGSDCEKPPACTGSEPYLSLDLIEHRIVEHRESIRVSWFSASGAFDHDRTGRAEAEAARTNTENAWTAPNSEADVNLWVVIRDDRGGVGWSSYVIHVTR